MDFYEKKVSKTLHDDILNFLAESKDGLLILSKWRWFIKEPLTHFKKIRNLVRKWSDIACQSGLLFNAYNMPDQDTFWRVAYENEHKVGDRGMNSHVSKILQNPITGPFWQEVPKNISQRKKFEKLVQRVDEGEDIIWSCNIKNAIGNNAFMVATQNRLLLFFNDSFTLKWNGILGPIIFGKKKELGQVSFLTKPEVSPDNLIWSRTYTLLKNKGESKETYKMRKSEFYDLFIGTNGGSWGDFDYE